MVLTKSNIGPYKSLQGPYLALVQVPGNHELYECWGWELSVCLCEWNACMLCTGIWIWQLLAAVHVNEVIMHNEQAHEYGVVGSASLLM